MNTPLNIVVTNNTAEVEALVSAGACPVECSVGGLSIVDALMMDHHGELGHLESVALRAYRDHYAARVADPRFVIVGVADADACFAVAALAGLLPHPDRDVAGIPPHIAKGLTRDLLPLALTVADIDTDPIGRDVAGMEGGPVLLAWNALTTGQNRSTAGAVAGVQLWQTLTDGHPARRPLIEAAKATEAERRAIAGNVDVYAHGSQGEIGVVEDSAVFGFDVWYGRQLGASADSAAGWAHPVVLAYNASAGNITIGCPNEKVAREIFGPGGLSNVFPLLNAGSPGWGGRCAIGGSPRGVKLPLAALYSAVEPVERAMVMRNRTPT